MKSGHDNIGKRHTLLNGQRLFCSRWQSTYHCEPPLVGIQEIMHKERGCGNPAFMVESIQKGEIATLRSRWQIHRVGTHAPHRKKACLFLMDSSSHHLGWRIPQGKALTTASTLQGVRPFAHHTL